jgi:hypothetical protein
MKDIVEENTEQVCATVNKKVNDEEDTNTCVQEMRTA